MERDWYQGPYRIVTGADELGKMPRIGKGDIIIHKTGAVIIRCPACSSMQFGRTAIINSAERPTFVNAIQCGSGHCKKCGVWFTIKDGRSEPAEPPKKKEITIPTALTDAGIGPARVGAGQKVHPQHRLGDLRKK